jgi:YidC/Oxa1 family membrane protein insertase
MSDSNITKLALANSSKGLMVKEAFSNISVKDIVDDCGLTRQAFYYHFKDKYDLVKLYFVIPQPLKYMAGIFTKAIVQLYKMVPQGADKLANIEDLSIISYFSGHTELMEKVAYLLKPADLFNMDFLGINLAAIPAWNPSVDKNPSVGLHSFLLLLIPILSALIFYIAVKYSVQAKPQTISDQMQPTRQKICS